MQLLTIKEAAGKLNVKIGTVRSWVENGKIPAKAVKRFPGARTVRIEGEALEKWVASLHAGSK